MSEQSTKTTKDSELNNEINKNESFVKKVGKEPLEPENNITESEIEKDLKNKLLRLAAELENTRRRSDQQASDLKKYAISDFAKEVIGVLENFYLIMDNAPTEEISQNDAIKSFFEGVKITHNDLLKVFEKNGIKRISPLGEKFDHHTQQVVSQIDSDKESGTVIKVLQAGYILNDRLLKEAMVVVAK